MPDQILPKRSFTVGAVPTTAELSINELAVNWNDGKAFTKNAAGQIVSVTMGGGRTSVVEVPTAASLPATGASGVLYVTDASRVYRWVGSVYVEIGPQ
jgi:hypothetical protein